MADFVYVTANTALFEGKVFKCSLKVKTVNRDTVSDLDKPYLFEG